MSYSCSPLTPDFVPQDFAHRLFLTDKRRAKGTRGRAAVSEMMSFWSWRSLWAWKRIMCKLLRVVRQQQRCPVGLKAEVRGQIHSFAQTINCIKLDFFNCGNIIYGWQSYWLFKERIVLWFVFFLSGCFFIYLKLQTTYSPALLFHPLPLHACRERRPSLTWSSTTSRPHTSTSPSTSTSAPEDGRLRLTWWGRWEAAVHTYAR